MANGKFKITRFRVIPTKKGIEAPIVEQKVVRLGDNPRLRENPQVKKTVMMRRRRAAKIFGGMK